MTTNKLTGRFANCLIRSPDTIEPSYLGERFPVEFFIDRNVLICCIMKRKYGSVESLMLPCKSICVNKNFRLPEAPISRESFREISSDNCLCTCRGLYLAPALGRCRLSGFVKLSEQSILMQKDFDAWNERKKHINDIEPHFYREGEVWWCSIGVNVGVEMDGKGSNFDRPVVVVKGFSRDSLLIVCLTGHRKDDSHHVYLGKIYDRDASANLSQVKLIDSRRLIERLETLDEHLFFYLKTAIRDYIFGTNSPPNSHSRGPGHWP